MTVEGKQRDIDAEDLAGAPRFWQPRGRRAKGNNQGDLCLRSMRHFDDPHPPHFDLSSNGCRCRGQNGCTDTADKTIVVADQKRAPVDKPESEIRFSGARRPLNQHGFPSD